MESALENGGRAVIEGEDYAHLARVLRLKVGEELSLVDARGIRFAAKVAAIGRSQVEAGQLQAQAPDARLAPLRLGICLPSADAFDAALDAAVQLGATEITPLLSKRSQALAKDKSGRWARMAREACCQSLRSELPQIRAAASLESFLAAGGLKLLMDPAGAPLKGPLEAEEIGLLIGPEGGFEPEEIAAAEAKGWKRVSLGRGILRVPVAVAAALSAVRALRKA